MLYHSLNAILCPLLPAKAHQLVSIKVYFTAIHHNQIAVGFDDSHHSSVSKLKLVTDSVARARAQSATPQCSPIRPPDILRQIHHLWLSSSSDRDTIMLGFLHHCLLRILPSGGDNHAIAIRL